MIHGSIVVARGKVEQIWQVQNTRKQTQNGVRSQGREINTISQTKVSHLAEWRRQGTVQFGRMLIFPWFGNFQTSIALEKLAHNSVSHGFAGTNRTFLAVVVGITIVRIILAILLAIRIDVVSLQCHVFKISPCLGQGWRVVLVVFRLIQVGIVPRKILSHVQGNPTTPCHATRIILQKSNLFLVVFAVQSG